jgi:hypothetical protein
MATLAELEEGLKRAYNAGNMEYARVLGAEILRLREAGQPQEPAEERTVAEDVGRQLGLTARAGVQGLGSVVGLLSDPLGALINQVLPEDGPRAQTARSLATQLADVLGLPKPETPTERVVGAVTEGGLSAATGVGAASQVGRATTGLAQQGARVLAAEPGAQVVAGAAGAGGAEAVAEGGGGPVEQTLAALAAGAPAGAATARMAAARQPQQVPAQVSSLIQQAEQASIPLMTSDVLPPETFVGRTAQAAGERIPVAGTGPARQTQQQARVDAVRRISEEYGAGVGTRFDEQVSADLVKRRGEDLTRYTQLKDQVFAGVENAGAVPVPKAVAQIDKEIADLRKLGDAVPANVITELENFRNSIQNQGIRDLDKLRKILGDKLKSPELASARSVTDKIPSRVYGAVRDDIGEFVKSQGGQREYTKWRIANARLAQMADEADNVKLRNALNRGSETPETVNSLLFSRNRSDVARLYRNLTPDGRAAARSAVIQRAVEKAGGLENISPQKFASEIERLSDQVGVLFNAQQKQQLDGLARVIKATQRASEAAASPPTGAQLAIPVGAAALTDILGGFGAATASGATIGGLARAYESKPVRDILLKLGATKPNSKQEGQLLRRIMPALVEFNRNQSQMSQERPNQGSRL